MKKIAFLCLLVAISACKAKNEHGQTDEEVMRQHITEVAAGVQQMQVANSDLTITYKGKEYRIQIKRTPDENLPLVKSSSGKQFVDNTVSVKITRGQENVFSREFNKNSFSSVVEASFLKNSVLEGIVYDKTTDGGIVLAASVCYPQTDLYYPLSVTITPGGQMTIRKEELLEDPFEE